MAEVKHTKGPWKIQWARNGTYPLGIHNGEVNIITAIGRPANPEAAANARLIAAAPELLECLRQLVDGMVDIEDSNDGVIRRSRAAISKATSGTQADGEGR
jgi:hypothetical protein